MKKKNNASFIYHFRETKARGRLTGRRLLRALRGPGPNLSRRDDKHHGVLLQKEPEVFIMRIHLVLHVRGAFRLESRNFHKLDSFDAVFIFLGSLVIECKSVFFLSLTFWYV